MVALPVRWPFARPADRPVVRPDRLLRDNPILLLSVLQAPDTVAGLVAEWNPAWRTAEATVVRSVSPTLPRPTRARKAAESIRWHGPLRLTPMLRADAGLPAGAEAEALHLVCGLARRLRGAARLPGGPIHVPHQDAPLPGDGGHAVFSHEMPPWTVVREILRPLAPDLIREAAPDGGGYVLRQRGLLEVRVRPAGPGTRVPPALRDRADDAWPRSIYEFCDMAQDPGRPGARGAHGTSTARPAYAAAALIAEVTGGVHLDADGFPAGIRTFATR